MTSFVYIYLHEQSQSDELRWSIRSVERFFQGDAHIVIAGDRPPWYSGDCINIPKSGGWFHDVHNKLWIACQSRHVTEQFVWMMDDIYFMRPFTLDELAVPRANRSFSQSDIDRWKGDSKWQEARRRSFAEILKFRDRAWDYATHMPHVTEKQSVLELFDRWDMLHGGYLFELMYGAIHWGEPERLTQFRYLNRKMRSPSEIQMKTEGKLVLNNGVTAWNHVLRDFLAATFPIRSDLENGTDHINPRRETMVKRMLAKESIGDLIKVNSDRVVFRGNSLGLQYSIRSINQNWKHDNVEIAFANAAPAWFLGDIVDGSVISSHSYTRPVIAVRETEQLDPVHIEAARVSSPADIDVLRNGHPVVQFDHWTPAIEQWANSLFPNPCHLEVDDPDVDRSLLRYGANKWTLDCEFRGEKIDEIHGKHCPYRKELQPVFQCEKHGKCSLVELGRPGIQACNRCPVTIERAHVSS